MTKKNFRGRDDLIVKEMDGETIVYDEQSNQVHSLNKTATLLWNLCDGENDIEGMVGEIRARFDVDEATARCDAEKILREFETMGLLRS